MKTFFQKGQIYGPIMPKSLRQRKDVSLGAKVLYSVLCSCAYRSGDHCWPSQNYLADSMGMSIRSIQNYLRELEKLGLIMIQRGRFGSSLKYYFLKSALVMPGSPESLKKKHFDHSKKSTDSVYANNAHG